MLRSLVGSEMCIRDRCQLVRTTAAVQWSGGGEPPCQLVPRLFRATAPADRARLRPHAIRVWDHLQTLAPRGVSSLLQPGGKGAKKDRYLFCTEPYQTKPNQTYSTFPRQFLVDCWSQHGCLRFSSQFRPYSQPKNIVFCVALLQITMTVFENADLHDIL